MEGVRHSVLNEPERHLDASFDEYVRARRDRLLALATFLCAGDRAAAEDLVQDVLTSTYPHWPNISPAAREAYVRKGLVRAAGRWRRRRPLSVSVDPAGLTGLQRLHSPPRPHDQSLEDTSGALDLAPYLQSLSRRQRAVVVLRYSEDLDDATIAAVLGCSTGAVKSHGARALEKLRSRLTREEPNDED